MPLRQKVGGGGLPPCPPAPATLYVGVCDVYNMRYVICWGFITSIYTMTAPIYIILWYSPMNVNSTKLDIALLNHTVCHFHHFHVVIQCVLPWNWGVPDSIIDHRWDRPTPCEPRPFWLLSSSDARRRPPGGTRVNMLGYLHCGGEWDRGSDRLSDTAAPPDNWSPMYPAHFKHIGRPPCHGKMV